MRRAEFAPTRVRTNKPTSSHKNAIMHRNFRGFAGAAGPIRAWCECIYVVCFMRLVRNML